MIAISAALAAAMMVAAPLHQVHAHPAPSLVPGAATRHPTVYAGPRHGWRSIYAPVPEHVRPDPACGFCQKASYVIAPAPPPNTMPDPAKTPGVTRDLATQAVCSTKWGHDERAVTAAMKRAVFAAYGFTGNDDPRCIHDAHRGRCEIDHLISRELGGADDVRNLWPEPYGGPWNAHDKDRIENRLHVEVCAGRLNLLQAQAMIRTDWQGAYRTYFGEPQSAAAPPAPAGANTGDHL